MARAKKKPPLELEPAPEPATRNEALSALGLSGEVNDDDVRAAFRERLKAAHPDINGGTDAMLRRLLLAREMLMSPSNHVAQATELLQNFSAPLDDSVRLNIGLAMALSGGEVEVDVPALEVSAADEAVTSLSQMKAMRVPVPAGVRNGDILRVATEGARPQQLFRVHIEAGDGIRIWGDDIWMSARIEARIFALGGLARLETPHGLQHVAVEKDVPRGSSLCLKGLGLPATSTRRAGDLHVRLEAVMNHVPSYSEALGDFRRKWAS